jgi:hypothetical protein
MFFDPSNCFLKIWESIRTWTPKVGTYLGVCGLILSHSPTLLGMWMWLPCCTFNSHLSMPLALVMSPKLNHDNNHGKLLFFIHMNVKEFKQKIHLSFLFKFCFRTFKTTHKIIINYAKDSQKDSHNKTHLMSKK